jgi:sugar lactone lactonase YvrE
VADHGSGSIYEIMPGGAKSTFASGLNQPTGLAFDSTGDLFVTATGSNSVYEITSGGAKSLYASGFYDPQGLAFNSNDDLFIADLSTETITLLPPGGSQTTFATVYDPCELAFDTAGNLFVGELDGYIVKITPAGAVSNFSTLTGDVGVPFLAFQTVLQSLSITLTTTNSVLISWPSSSIDYALEQNPVLVTTNWVLNTNKASLVKGTNQVAVFPVNKTMFYRLVNP